MSERRKWKLTVTTAREEAERCEEFLLESTGVIHPATQNQFLNWGGSDGRVISYNSNNVISWNIEEVHND